MAKTATIILVAATIALAACAPASPTAMPPSQTMVPTPTATEQPSPKPTPLPPSPTPTYTPSPSPTPTETPTPVPPTPTPTLSPIPTPDPWSDPDNDGYPTYFEQVWRTYPLTFTSFEDLAHHPGTIYAKMRVSQPFEFADMNGTIYQVARFISVEDNGTPDNPSDDHLIFDVVLFPYATRPNIATQVNEFPIDPSTYPAEVQPYLESTQISNLTPEMKETLLEVVAGARTDVEAIDRILRWNENSLTRLPTDHWLFFYEVISLRAGDLFSARQIWQSTSKATLLAAEMRAIGIPTGIIFGVYTTEEPSYAAFDHPQNVVFLNNQWVRLDYHRGLNYRGSRVRDPYSYEYLAITEFYRDTTEVDWSTYIYIIDYYGEKPPEVYLELHEPLEMREN